MKTTLSLLFLLLSLPAAAKDCAVQGLAEVTLPEWASCEDFKSNFELAKKMVRDWKWASEKEMRIAWAYVHVTVVDASGFPCGAARHAQGCTSENEGTILLSRDGHGLLHELLHMLDPSREHGRWEKNGWRNAADVAFPVHYIPLTSASR